MTSKIFRSTIFVAIAVLLCSVGIILGVLPSLSALLGIRHSTLFLRTKLRYYDIKIRRQ